MDAIAASTSEVSYNWVFNAVWKSKIACHAEKFENTLAPFITPISKREPATLAGLYVVREDRAIYCANIHVNA